MRYAHITLGKAGSQWIKDVLSDPDIFSLQPELQFFSPPKGGEYRISDFAREPENTFAAPIYHVVREDWERYAQPGDRCIVILRDPRDSVVSWAFSIAYSHVTEEHVKIIRPTLLALDLRGKLEVGMYTFWESAYAQRSWAEKPRNETEFVLTYEDIVADQRRAFRDILDFYDWRVPDEVLDVVIDRLSFETRSGRKRGEKQEFSHYRSGVAGDWRNYFDRDLGERFERACPGLLVALGYESDSNWYKQLPKAIASLDEGGLGSQGTVAHLEETVAKLRQKNDLLAALAQERLEALEEAIKIAERVTPRS